MDKIEALKREIWEIDREISEKEVERQKKASEIDRLYIEAHGGTYLGSYICYEDENGYTFMKVMEQWISEKGDAIVLSGPSISADDNPLDDDYDEDFIDCVKFNNYDRISFGSMVMQDLAFETVRKLTEEEADMVADRCKKLLDKKFLGKYL